MTTILKGTSIIEIVIATALISVAIIAALSLSNRSQYQNTYARDLAEATKYNTEVSDWLRTERNRLGWATISDKLTTDDSGGGSTTYCLNSLAGQTFLTLAPGPCGETEFIANSIFQREVVMSHKNDQTILAVISVVWQEKIERQASLEMELNQW